MSSVQICQNSQQADQLLGNQISGFAYQRDGHPNEFVLSERIRELHRADFAAVTPNGMAALSLAMLALLKSGDRVLLSNQLYGKTKALFENEATRFGIETDYFAFDDLADATNKLTDRTRMIVAETISNPLMQVVDIVGLSEIAKHNGALLLIDNTFASPVVCQPLELGADLVMESLTKIMNGHSDVLMGALCGREKHRAAVNQSQRIWGLVGSPFDCWLADRGLGSLALRVQQAASSAETIAQTLAKSISKGGFVKSIFHPSLGSVGKIELAGRQFLSSCDGKTLYGNMMSLELSSRQLADKFVSKSGLLFCPSLGDLATTISHPATTSHRGLTAEQRKKLGIEEGLLRISVGTEPVDLLMGRINNGLNGLDDIGF